MQPTEKTRGMNVSADIAKQIKELRGGFNDFPAEKLVESADKLGDCLANQVRLKTSQIRKFLDAVNKIKSEGRKGKEASYFREQATFLKPKLAYSAGRNREVGTLMDVIAPCIDKINTRADFDRFARFVEAIVAYHKFHGGRDT